MSTDGRQPIFVLGAARTGTTLLQRLLNSYDDILIWGEHAGFLEDVARGFFRAWENPNVFQATNRVGDVLHDSRPADTWQGWMGWSGREDWVRTFRTFVESLFVPDGLPGKRHWGFKEIRYLATPGDRILEFLRLLYPDGIFVFIVRHPLNAIASVRRIPEGAHRLDELRRLCKGWESRYRAYRAWYEADPGRSFWIVYEEMIQERGDILRLLRALGRTLGTAQRAIMESADARWSSFKDADVNERWRQLPAAWIAVIAALLGPLCRDLGYPLPAGARRYRVPGRLLVRGLDLLDALRPATPRVRPAAAPAAHGASRPLTSGS